MGDDNFDNHLRHIFSMPDLPWFNFGKLPTDAELLDDLKLYRLEGSVGKSFFRQKVYFARTPERPAFDECRDIPPETWERLRKWSHRNVLSVEERARIWEDEPLPMFMGCDIGSAPSSSSWARAWFEDGRMKYEPLDPIEFIEPLPDVGYFADMIRQSREEIDNSFYANVFAMMKGEEE